VQLTAPNQSEWRETITETLLDIVESGRYDDPTLVCYDIKITPARTILAFAYPSLYSVL
jgi:hypothetical protein